MKNPEFIALVMANSSRTPHIRAFTKPWCTGASRVPDNISSQIGRIIALLQAMVDNESLCKKNEYLLIYNFQPLHMSEGVYLCSLDILVKPISQIMLTEDKNGRPLQLVIDCISGEVMNNTKGLIAVELIEEGEALEEGLEAPFSYGNYNDYQALCCVIAITVDHSIKDFQDVFTGKLDQHNSLQEAVAFDTISEANSFLEKRKELGRYILELSCPKEKINEHKKDGLSKISTKVIEYFTKKVILNPHLSAQQTKEEVIEKKELSELFNTSSAVSPLLDEKSPGSSEHEKSLGNSDKSQSPLLTFSQPVQTPEKTESNTLVKSQERLG